MGLLSGSPGSALKAKVLKSEDSINERDTGISTPVATTAGASGSAALLIITTGAGDEIQ